MSTTNSKKHYRWVVVITYNSKEGPIDVQYQIEELFELHNIIERGPRFSTVEKIEIRLNGKRRRPNVYVDEIPVR